MTEPAPAWTSRRRIGLTLLMAALHAGGFWLIARFPPGPAPSAPDPFRLVWSSAPPDPLEGSLVSPTRFALPGEGGFSGDAARALPPVAYGWGRTEPRPSFLSADPDGSQLGPPPAPPPPPARDPMPLGPMPPTDSVGRMTLDEARIEIGGGLRSRRLAVSPKVAPWTGGDSPQPTRIELAVDPWGDVVTARILATSGSRPADLAALEAVRGARFQPLPGAGRGDSLRADRLTWGVASVHPVPGEPPPVPSRAP